MADTNIVIKTADAVSLLQRMIKAARQEHQLNQGEFASELRQVAPRESGIAYRSARAVLSWARSFATAPSRAPATAALVEFLDILDQNGKVMFDMDKPLGFIAP
jgi:hypothetical protein